MDFFTASFVVDRERDDFITALILIPIALKSLKKNKEKHYSYKYNCY